MAGTPIDAKFILSRYDFDETSFPSKYVWVAGIRCTGTGVSVGDIINFQLTPLSPNFPTEQDIELSTDYDGEGGNFQTPYFEAGKYFSISAVSNINFVGLSNYYACFIKFITDDPSLYLEFKASNFKINGVPVSGQEDIIWRNYVDNVDKDEIVGTYWDASVSKHRFSIKFRYNSNFNLVSGNTLSLAMTPTGVSNSSLALTSDKFTLAGTLSSLIAIQANDTVLPNETIELFFTVDTAELTSFSFVFEEPKSTFSTWQSLRGTQYYTGYYPVPYNLNDSTSFTIKKATGRVRIVNSTPVKWNGSAYVFSMKCKNDSVYPITNDVNLKLQQGALLSSNGVTSRWADTTLTCSKGTAVKDGVYFFTWDINLGSDIAPNEEFFIDGVIAVAQGSLIAEKFTGFGYFGSSITEQFVLDQSSSFYFFGGLVGISEGLEVGSTEVKCVVDADTGSTVLLYRGLVQVGSGTVTDGGLVTIDLTANPVVGGEPYTAYLENAGFGTFGSFMPSLATPKSGWKMPDRVYQNGGYITYEDYLLAGGQPIADFYDPKNTINRAAKANLTVIDFDLKPNFDLQVIRDGNNYIVTLYNVSPFLGNPRVSWDSEALTTVLSKTYTPSGTVTQSVRVYHETDDTIFQDRVFTLLGTLNSYTSEIWGVSYSSNESDNKQISPIAHTKDPAGLEARIPEIGSTWYSMDQNNPKTYRYSRGGIYYNVSAGNKTLEIRRVGQPAAEVVMPIKLDW